MSDKNSSFFSLSKSVAENFLQTAIVVDDQAYFDKPVSSDKQTDSGFEGNTGADDYQLQAPPEEERSNGPSHLLDAKTVVDSFAQKGIVCSVLKPDKQDMESLFRTLIKLATSADIIVLDWDLNKDKGQAVLQLINEIAVNDETPHQLRLVVIYTGEPDVGGVAQKISDMLATISDLNVNQDQKKLSFSVRSMRIVVFAKPETPVAPEFVSRKISFKNLADTVTEEFTEMTSGLVSNVVLESLAQIRKNTHKILSGFSADLDAPYLTHRILHADPEDAEDQLTALVAGELQAILEESRIAKKANLESIKVWIKDKQLLESKKDYLPPNLSAELKVVLDNTSFDHQRKFQSIQKVCEVLSSEDTDPNLIKFIKELLAILHKPVKPQRKLNSIIGWFNDNRVPPFILSIDDTVQELTQKQVISLLEVGIENSPDFGTRYKERAHKYSFTNLFLNHQENHHLDEDFAVITTLRSFYDQGEHRLTLGTIVEHSDSYLVCIQPRCDTYRITETRVFPFLPLSTLNSDRNFDVVIRKETHYLRMSISKKPYDLRLFSFEPNDKQVIDTINQIFIDIDGNTFKWVGELRIEQAQRLSNRFATELSRVGVNESQWLRRWSTKE